MHSTAVGEGSVVNFLVASVGVLHFRQRLKAQENVFKVFVKRILLLLVVDHVGFALCGSLDLLSDP